MLKAWFAESTPLKAHLALKPRHHPDAGHAAPEDPVGLAAPAANGSLVAYAGGDADQITVEGELNKLFCNVAMGRSMGDVHWRSDNTRSLRPGEQVAAEMLRSESLDYVERRQGGLPPTWSFRTFDGDDVLIFAGRVLVNGVQVDPKAGPL